MKDKEESCTIDVYIPAGRVKCKFEITTSSSTNASSRKEMRRMVNMLFDALRMDGIDFEDMRLTMMKGAAMMPTTSEFVNDPN